MNKASTFWLHKRRLRRISWTVLFFFIFNIITYELTSWPILNRYISIQPAVAAVADRNGLGIEEFWSYYSKDIGAGWKYNVNTFSGNLVVQQNPFSIPGRGIGLSEGLSYNSLSSQSGCIGKGWVLTNQLAIKENADDSVTFKDRDATNHKFIRKDDGSYTAPSGVNLTLSKIETGVFTIKDQAQILLRFENERIISFTDEKGNATTFSYNAGNQLTQVTDTSGRKLVYSYDASSGKLTSVTDPASRSVTMSYDETGQLATLTDPEGAITRFGYDTSGQLNAITDANGHKTSFFYNSEGKVIKIADARSTPNKEYATTLSYDANLLKTTVTDPANRNVVFTHNSAGNLVEILDALGNTIKYTWDKNNLVKVDDANGSTTATYDSNGNVTQIFDTIDPGNTATTNIDYDSRNNPTELTDANGNKETAEYDEDSNLLSTANPERKEADANTYDSYGNITSSTDPGSPTYNLLENGSFEWKDTEGKPLFWGISGDNTVVSIDNTVARFGNSSAKISSTTSTSAYLYSQPVPVVPGQKLTFSAPVLMNNVAGNGGVDIGIEFYDANWSYLGSEYSNTYDGIGNTSLVVTANAPSGTAYAFAILELWQASGTVWFDGAQMVSPINAAEDHILTKFDYIENSSFECGMDYWWSGGAEGATSLTGEAAWGGNNSAKINLASVDSAWLGSYCIPVIPGEPLTLSGFVKTVNLNGYGARIEVEYYDQNNNYLGFNCTKLQSNTQDFTRYATPITPPANTAYLTAFGVVYSSKGAAYFDNIKIVPRATTVYGYDSASNYLTDNIDPQGSWTNYTYDAAGNRTSINDPKGKITHFG